MSSSDDKKVEEVPTVSADEEENAEEAIVVTKLLRDCPMESVMLYSDRCEVTRVVEHVFDKPGLYDICLEGMPGSAQTETLRVSGGFGNATVLEVSTKRRFDQDAEAKTLPEAVKAKKETVKQLEAKVGDLQVRKSALDTSAKWLEEWSQDVANTPLGQVKSKGAGGVPFLSEEYITNVRNFTEFYATEHERIAREDAALREEMQVAMEELKRAKDDLNVTTRRMNAGHVVIIAVISLQVTAPGEAGFHLVYRCTGCRWTSKYDCRVDENKNIQVTYYGAVTNSTGETWQNTRLTLSTAEPAAGGEPPELETAKVSFLPEVVKTRAKASFMSRSAKGSAPMDEDLCCVEECAEEEAEPMVMNVVVAETKRGMTSSTFEIPRRTTIESDGESHKVTIAVVPDIEAKIEYLLLPRLHDSVYMKAVCNNPCDFCFLEGPCNVFVEGSFVATSPMEYTAAGQPFSFFFGPDKDLRVDYMVPTSVADKTGIFKNNADTFTGEIRVKNNKDKEVKITIQDQLPKSSSEEIKVTLVEPDVQQTPSVSIGERNLITWVKTISAGQTEVFPIKFTVEYPKGKEIEYHW